MSRCVLVGLLIFSLSLTGCAGQQSWLKPTSLDELKLPLDSYPDWIDKHPVLKGSTYVLLLVGTGIVVCGVVLLCLWAEGQDEHSDPYNLGPTRQQLPHPPPPRR